MIIMNFEILAPAGSMESLIAGVRSGANGVYLGGKAFNARRNAGNFDFDELKEAVDYCHSRRVKVYYTLNILVSDDEWELAYDTVKQALEAGVDAFIVQDLGIIKMIKEHFPSARLHGSTQMSVMTPLGVKYAKELGLSRIVLPREMSLEEITEIKSSCDLELEVFVHGALCMCVSGQCYLSSLIGSRSGNRGLCAQPCRLPFTAKNDKNEYALSLKDLSIIERLGDLEGVTSLKIEGRMKRPEYVAAAVTAVKNAVNGKYDLGDSFKLRSIFSRSGFTDGYLTGRVNADMFGTRQKEDVTAAGGVLKELQGSYSKEKATVPVSMSFVCREGEPCVLTASDFEKTVTVTGDAPEKAINKPMTAESVEERLKKLGGTPYFAEKINVELQDGLVVSAAKINGMRREATELLLKRKANNISVLPLEKRTEKPPKRSVGFTVAVFKNANQIPLKHPFDNVFIPVDSSLEDFVDNRAGVVLPRGLFSSEQRLEKELGRLKKAGVSKALCGNIGSYRLAKEMGFQVFGDFGLNVYNSESASMIDNPLLSFELTTKQIENISAVNKGALVYGKVPLMLMRNCPVKNSIGCEKCGRKGKLTDRKGYEFEVLCSGYPCVEMLNPYPVYMLDRMDEISADYAYFYFSTESVGEVENIIKLYETGETPDFKYTRGLYTRGAL